MVKMPEKEYTKRSILRLILDRRYISRQDVAQILNIDQRTVASYTDALEQMRLIAREDVAESKGRPRVYYRPTIGKLIYLGIYLYKDLYISVNNVDKYQIDFAKVDFAGRDFDVEAALEAIEKLIARHQELNLAGIGMVINTYHPTPIRKRFFFELGKRLKEQFQVDLNQCNTSSANLLAYAIRHDFHPYHLRVNSFRLGLIDPSDTVILGLYIDEMPYPYTPNGSKQFAAIQKGVMTHRMILDAYRELAGTTLDGMSRYRLLLSDDDPAAVEVMKREAKQLAGAVLRFQKQYQLEKIFLSHVHLKTLDEVRRLTGGVVPLEIMSDCQMEDITASVMLAMHNSIGGFYRA